MSEDMAFVVVVQEPYEQVVDRVRAALKEEGFGVLTEIDVKATLKEKLDEDFRPYIILGACNPPLAHRALSADAKVGVMLPCNVTVESNDGKSTVCIANPSAMMSTGPLGENPEIVEVANEARTRLERVAASLRG